MRTAIQRLALEREHYFGYPVPDDMQRLVMSPNCPVPGLAGFRLASEESNTEDQAAYEEMLRLTSAAINARKEESEARGEPLSRIELLSLIRQMTASVEFINGWFVKHKQKYVYLYRNTVTGKTVISWSKYPHTIQLDYEINSLGASRNWDLEAEMRAMLKLQTHITPIAFFYYVMTGTFLETSKQSGITYLFRRLRPTIALRAVGDYVKPLCALCMHPLGYYEKTYAGVMVPTDDVIAHVLLMRSDERRYWASCNQHELSDPVAGL